MRQDSADFSGYNKAKNKKPKYTVRVYFDNDNTDYVEFTSHDNAETSGGESIKNTVISYSGISQKINPEQGNSTIGGFTFKLLDKNNEVTEKFRDKLNAGNGLRHKRVQCYVGYEGQLWANYSRILTYIIDGVTYNNGVYTFTCSDIQRIVRKDIFNLSEAVLSKSVTSSQLHIPILLADLTKFPTVLHDSSYPSRPNTSVGYIQLEEEVIAHVGFETHATDGLSFTVAPDDGSGTTGRGQFGTVASTHTLPESVTEKRNLKIVEHVFLSGAAPKVTYQLLTGHVAENLLLNSEDITTTWTPNFSAVEANVGLAPDGSNTADRINPAIVDNIHNVYQSFTVESLKNYTVSAWVKSDGDRYAFISYWQSATNYVTAVFDLLTQTLTDTNTNSATLKHYGIVDYGDWSRIYIAGDVGAYTTVYIQVGPANSAKPTYSGGRPTFLAVAGEDLLLWGAQASQTNYLIPYVGTTTVAQAKETLPSNWHIGMDHELVRLENFTRIGKDIWNQFDDSGRLARFEGHKKTDGKKFIETELMYWIPAFMPIYSDGQIGMKLLSPILSDSSSIRSLDSRVIKKYSELNHDYKSVINQIVIEWNYNFQDDKFTKTNILLDADSINKHNLSEVKNLKLKGVHTGIHTDEELANYFDSMRDRYSGPPERLNIDVMPSLNDLEVGDVIQVNLPQIRDFNVVSNTELNRPFEIQQVSNNWITGDVKLNLFGSSQKAGALVRSSLTTVLDDGFYSSEGTELGAYLNGIQAGTVVSDEIVLPCTLAGSDTMSEGVYYYLGNLTISAKVTFTNNVQLRVRGHLAIEAVIDGSGGGYSGGLGSSLLYVNGQEVTSVQYPTSQEIDKIADLKAKIINNLGTPGYLGHTKSQSGISIRAARGVIHHPEMATTLGVVGSIPNFSLTNNLTELNGIPETLIGTSGGGGELITVAFFGGTISVMADGGDGGSSGAGLIIISRGGSFAGNGAIDTSGIDGQSGELYEFAAPFVSDATYRAGSGAGGSPGGLAWLLDGDHTPPEVLNNHVANQGDSPIIGITDLPSTSSTGALNAGTYTSKEIGIVGYNLNGLAGSAYSLQYIPESEIIEEEIAPPPPDVTDFTAGTSGDTVVFRWSEVVDKYLNGYEIRYSPDTVNDWDAAIILTATVKGTRITDTAINDGSWKFYIKAIGLNGKHSQNAVTYDLVVTSPFNVITSNNEHPLWAGTKTNFVLHHTGKLIPRSQTLAADGGWDTFDIAVSNPYPLCTYESSELDVTFDDLVRAWSEVSGALMPGETGDTAITNYMDYRLAAGSYDGFEVWGVGEATGRYFKFKFELDTTKGVSYIDAQTIVADLLERTERADGVAIAGGGTSITFARAYHTPPHVNVNAVSSTALFAVASNITATGFDLDIYNTSGTSIGGTANWDSIGV